MNWLELVHFLCLGMHCLLVSPRTRGAVLWRDFPHWLNYCSMETNCCSEIGQVTFGQKILVWRWSAARLPQWSWGSRLLQCALVGRTEKESTCPIFGTCQPHRNCLLTPPVVALRWHFVLQGCVELCFSEDLQTCLPPGQRNHVSRPAARRQCLI